MSTPADTEQMAYTIVDDALKTYPIVDAPDTLLPAVITRIQAAPAAPHFRLTWFDFAISLFGAGMVGGLLLLWQLSGLPSWAQLQAEILLWLQQPEPLFILVTLFGGMVLTSIAIIVAANIFSQRAFILTVE